MSREPKITDEELKKELENGKSLKQIRNEYGYKGDNGALSNRIRRNFDSYTSNHGFSLGSNGATPYIPDKVVRKAVKIKGLCKDRGKYFFRPTVNADGDIVLSLTDKKWRKEDE